MDRCEICHSQFLTVKKDDAAFSGQEKTAHRLFLVG